MLPLNHSLLHFLNATLSAFGNGFPFFMPIGGGHTKSREAVYNQKLTCLLRRTSEETGCAHFLYWEEKWGMVQPASSFKKHLLSVPDEI